MSSYKPIQDAKAIEHLDWELCCQVHMFVYPKDAPRYEAEPPCEQKATMLVTYHTISTCRVLDQFMCLKHFKELFTDSPESHRNCPTCGARRFRSARPL